MTDSTAKKRKRQDGDDAPSDGPRIQYRPQGPTGRTFERMLKEKTLEDVKVTVGKKLGLDVGRQVTLSQVREGRMIDLEDEDDFDAFRAYASSCGYCEVAYALSEPTSVQIDEDREVEQPPKKRRTKKSPEREVVDEPIAVQSRGPTASGSRPAQRKKKVTNEEEVSPVVIISPNRTRTNSQSRAAAGKGISAVSKTRSTAKPKSKVNRGRATPESEDHVEFILPPTPEVYISPHRLHSRKDPVTKSSEVKPRKGVTEPEPSSKGKKTQDKKVPKGDEDEVEIVAKPKRKKEPGVEPFDPTKIQERPRPPAKRRKEKAVVATTSGSISGRGTPAQEVVDVLEKTFAEPKAKPFKSKSGKPPGVPAKEVNNGDGGSDFEEAEPDDKPKTRSAARPKKKQKMFVEISRQAPSDDDEPRELLEEIEPMKAEKPRKKKSRSKVDEDGHSTAQPSKDNNDAQEKEVEALVFPTIDIEQQLEAAKNPPPEKDRIKKTKKKRTKETVRNEESVGTGEGEGSKVKKQKEIRSFPQPGDEVTMEIVKQACAEKGVEFEWLEVFARSYKANSARNDEVALGIEKQTGLPTLAMDVDEETAVEENPPKKAKRRKEQKASEGLTSRSRSSEMTARPKKSRKKTGDQSHTDNTLSVSERPSHDRDAEALVEQDVQLDLWNGVEVIPASDDVLEDEHHDEDQPRLLSPQLGQDAEISTGHNTGEVRELFQWDDFKGSQPDTSGQPAISHKTRSELSTPDPAQTPQNGPSTWVAGDLLRNNDRPPAKVSVTDSPEVLPQPPRAYSPEWDMSDEQDQAVDPVIPAAVTNGPKNSPSKPPLKDLIQNSSQKRFTPDSADRTPADDGVGADEKRENNDAGSDEASETGSSASQPPTRESPSSATQWTVLPSPRSDSHHATTDDDHGEDELTEEISRIQAKPKKLKPAKPKTVVALQKGAQERASSAPVKETPNGVAKPFASLLSPFKPNLPLSQPNPVVPSSSQSNGRGSLPPKKIDHSLAFPTLSSLSSQTNLFKSSHPDPITIPKVVGHRKKASADPDEESESEDGPSEDNDSDSSAEEGESMIPKERRAGAGLINS